MTEPDRQAGVADEERIHEFAGGEIQSYEGRVDYWLLVVYAVLGVWAVYYVLKYWGGLGPGLGR